MKIDCHAQSFPRDCRTHKRANGNAVVTFARIRTGKLMDFRGEASGQTGETTKEQLAEKFRVRSRSKFL